MSPETLREVLLAVAFLLFVGAGVATVAMPELDDAAEPPVPTAPDAGR